MRRYSTFLSTVLLFRIAVPVSATAFPTRIVSTDGKPVIWTADWPTDVRIEFIESTNLNLELRCDLLNSVLGCKNKKPPEREKTSFCFQRPEDKDKVCYTFNKTNNVKTIMMGDVSLNITFDLLTGGKATYQQVPPDVPIGTLLIISCIDYSRDGVILTSNQIHVLDYRKNFPTDVWKPTEAPVFLRNSLATVKCLQTSLRLKEPLSPVIRFQQATVPVYFEWFVCTGTTVRECEMSKRPLRKVAPFGYWPMQVGEDGVLNSPFVPLSIESQLQGKALMCTLMNKPVAFYASPLRIDDSTAIDTVPAMIKPYAMQQVTVYNSDNYELRLPCLFTTPIANTTIVWSAKKGEEFTETLQPGASYSKYGVTVSDDADFITLKGPFTDLNGSRYSCDLNVGGTKIRSTYKINVDGPIIQSSEIPKKKFMISGQDASINCRFQGTRQIARSLAVNGKELDLKSQATIKSVMDEINGKFKGKRTSLNFTASSVNPEPNAILRYTEKSANYDNALDSTHVVTCIAKSVRYENRASIVLKTFPPPQLSLVVPKKCRNSCNLMVKLTNADIFKKECVDIQFSWFLNPTCSPNGTVVHRGATWNYDVSGSDTVHVCGCVSLIVDGQSFNSTCAGQKMELSFWSVKNPAMWLALLVIFIVIAVLAAVTFFVVKKCVLKRRTHERGTKMENRENKKEGRDLLRGEGAIG